MANTIGSISLNATERVALLTVLQAQQQCYDQLEKLDERKTEIARDIEKRLKLRAGSLGKTHQIDIDQWIVEKVVPENGKP